MLLKIQQEINKYKEYREVVKNYLQTKYSEADWKVVAELAVELQKLDDKIKLLETVKLELLADLAVQQKGDNVETKD